MGPSGSGKSTMLHIVGCLDSLDSGEVWLDGRRVDNLGRRDLASCGERKWALLPNIQPCAELHGSGECHAGG